MIARELGELITSLSKVDSRYDDCPFACVHEEPRYSLERQENCNSCPIKKQVRRTESQFYEALEAMLGEDHGYRYRDLENAYHTILSLEPLGSQILYKNYVMLRTIKAERKHG